MLTEENVDRIIARYNVILDGTDTFETRYTLNDAAVRAGIPVVHASVFRFEGQLTVFQPYAGPCYRCLYPTPPPPELAPGCSVAGVLGVVPGTLGILQATEAIKVLLGIGDPPWAGHDLRRARHVVPGAEAAPRPALPGMRRRCLDGRRSASRPHLRPRRPHLRARRPRLPPPRWWPGRSAAPIDVNHNRGFPDHVSKVRIPPVLRAQVEGKSRSRSRGSTVGDILEGLVAKFPGLGDQLLGGDGSLNRFVNVYLNDQDIRYLQELGTPVSPTDTVVILPAMAGGA